MRLAREQGLLSGPSLNPFQQFALTYWLYMDRRQRMDDQRAELEQMTFNLDESRWSQIYMPSMMMAGVPDDLGGGIPLGFADDSEPGEVAVTDIADLDEYFASLEKPRRMSAAEWPADDGRGWQ